MYENTMKQKHPNVIGPCPTVYRKLTMCTLSVHTVLLFRVLKTQIAICLMLERRTKEELTCAMIIPSKLLAYDHSLPWPL
jgi:hypothetical protein